MKYKYDEKLFWRYTKNACERKVTECQFADDAALLASTRAGAERMAVVYQRTSDNSGLTVSIPKTKHMAAGRLVDESDLRSPLRWWGEMWWLWMTSLILVLS